MIVQTVESSALGRFGQTDEVAAVELSGNELESVIDWSTDRIADAPTPSR